MIDEGDVYYRCMMVGFDEAWSPLQREAEFTFTSLPPGQYLLRLQAWAPLCGEGPVCEAAAFEVKAPWWVSRLTWLSNAVEAGRDMIVGQKRNSRLLRINEELARTVQLRTEELVRANNKLSNANTQLSVMARVDSLTMVPNRRAFSEVAAREWKRAIRDRSPIALLLIDIDFFKLYNDHYGHLEGDRCLKKVAQALNTCIREGIDFFARFGGEEFVACLTNCDHDEALLLAKRLCTTVSGLQLPHPGSPWKVVTVSVGVCSTTASERVTTDDVLASADKALFEAKHAGRNQASHQALEPKRFAPGQSISQGRP
jgi:diguanylate cyclase (GGDEF)-like protein